MLFQWTPKAKLWIRRGLRGSSGNYYCGLHEFEDMSFLLHFLRQGDLFVDVGANVGSFTVLASAHVGACTRAFEPVPSTFAWLNHNIESNTIAHLATAQAVAVGSQSGRAWFTSKLDAMNHLLAGKEVDSIEVPVDTLDHLLAGSTPILIKIDVEGFEAEVLAGARQVIATTSLQAIIAEMGTSSMPGDAGITTHQWLETQGFKAFAYQPFTRSLIQLSEPGHHNTLYLRDADFVLNRVVSAEAFVVMGEAI